MLIAWAIAGCGGDENPAQEGVGSDVSIGVPIELVDCTDWQDATVEARFGTIGELKNFIGDSVAGTSGGRGVVLDDEKAYDLFENYCENDFARGFKLYKLYSRAAGFGGE